VGRKPRLHIEGGLYHILTRGNNCEEIFRDDHDYSTFQETLLKLKGKTGFKLYAYCLMPNHFHLFMEVKSTSTSEIMQRLLTSYSKYYNKRYKKTGHLFQGRYKSIICEKDSYLLELVRYIHLNPYRAGLVKKPVDWEWNGHKEYIGQKRMGLIDKMEVLEIFSNNLKQAITGYSEFVRDGTQMRGGKEYYPEEKSPYLGDDKFIEDLMVRHINIMENKVPEKKICIKVTLKEIADRAAKKFSVSVEGICSRTRNRRITQARKVFIKEAINYGYKGIEVSTFLNCTQGYVTRINNKSNK